MTVGRVQWTHAPCPFQCGWQADIKYDETTEEETITQAAKAAVLDHLVEAHADEIKRQIMGGPADDPRD